MGGETSVPERKHCSAGKSNNFNSADRHKHNLSGLDIAKVFTGSTVLTELRLMLSLSSTPPLLLCLSHMPPKSHIWAHEAHFGAFNWYICWHNHNNAMFSLL